MVLIALVAGYARRISGEADRQQTLALDRLGRLADANALLFSLHRVAQSLPASLDLDECLDSTMGRLRDLFDFTAAAVLLLDDADRGWNVARREGTRLPPRIGVDDLPPALAAAVAERGVVSEPNLLITGGPGLAPRMYSGIYTVLLARGAVIGLVSLEHPEANHFTDRVRRAGRPRSRQRPLVRPVANGGRRGGTHANRPGSARPHRTVARVPRVRAGSHREERRPGGRCRTVTRAAPFGHS
jgi:uncharacterized protein YigA (DUF484 family)